MRGLTKHGHTWTGGRSPTYSSWLAMRDRCSNPARKEYANYGGRGIAVCERWLGPEGFENFLADMGPRPDGMTLDRCDGALGYWKENCRWATRSQQQQNTRVTKLDVDRVREIRQLVAVGESHRKVGQRMGVSAHTVRNIALRLKWKDVA